MDAPKKQDPPYETLPTLTKEQYQLLDNETKDESDEVDEHTH